MITFVINGKTYNAKPFDFNMICDLEDMNVNLEEFDRKPMSVIRAYFGLCLGNRADEAGRELNQHIISGGKFDELIEIVKAEMTESDFFRHLNKTEETEVAEKPETEIPAETVEKNEAE